MIHGSCIIGNDGYFHPPLMELALKVMGFVRKMMRSAFKMMNSGLTKMNSVSTGPCHRQ